VHQLSPSTRVFERQHLGATADLTGYVAELNGMKMEVANFIKQPE
jgi:hypothetical protein